MAKIEKVCKYPNCKIKYYAKDCCRLHYDRLPEVKARRVSKGKINREKYKEKTKIRYRVWSDKIRNETLMHYSDGNLSCGRCGFNDIRVLELDHINGGGNLHRKRLTGNAKSGGGITTYLDLKSKGFPSGYQVLCRNCNWIKYIEIASLRIQRFDTVEKR